MAKREIKRFLEIEEVLGDSNADKDPVILKEEVPERAVAFTRHNQLKTTLAGRKYRAYVHVCGHQKNGKNVPCVRELIEEKV